MRIFSYSAPLSFLLAFSWEAQCSKCSEVLEQSPLRAITIEDSPGASLNGICPADSAAIVATIQNFIPLYSDQPSSVVEGGHISNSPGYSSKAYQFIGWKILDPRGSAPAYDDIGGYTRGDFLRFFLQVVAENPQDRQMIRTHRLIALAKFEGLVGPSPTTLLAYYWDDPESYVRRQISKGFTTVSYIFQNTSAEQFDRFLNHVQTQNLSINPFATDARKQIMNAVRNFTNHTGEKLPIPVLGCCIL